MLKGTEAMVAKAKLPRENAVQAWAQKHDLSAAAAGRILGVTKNCALYWIRGYRPGGAPARPTETALRLIDAYENNGWRPTPAA